MRSTRRTPNGLHPVDADQKRIYKYEDGEGLQRFDGVFEKDEEEQEADEHDRRGGDIQVFDDVTLREIVRSDEMPFENLVLVERDVGGQGSKSLAGHYDGCLQIEGAESVYRANCDPHGRDGKEDQPECFPVFLRAYFFYGIVEEEVEQREDQEELQQG